MSGMKKKETFISLGKAYIEYYKRSCEIDSFMGSFGFNFSDDADPLCIAVERYFNSYFEYATEWLIDLAEDGYLEIESVDEETGEVEEYRITTVEELWDEIKGY